MQKKTRLPAQGQRKPLLRTAAVFILLYALIVAGCASLQRRLIYFPPVLTHEQADRMGKSARLDRWQNAAGEDLGWKRLAPVQPATGRILITHGNGGCAVQCARYADVIQQTAPLDVYIVEYPGYADCPGKPTEKSLDKAADDAFQALPGNSPIYLVGESLGTGVAAYLAGKYPDQVAGIILLAPFTCLADVGQAHMPILPVHLILCDQFPSQDYLQKYHGPVAVLVGGEDQVVPEKFGRGLFDGYAGPKRIWEFPNGNHGTVMEQPSAVWKEILDFLRSKESVSNR